MKEIEFVGIDGESDTVGKDHRYTLLAASGTNGVQRWVYDAKGLSTVRCFEFILDLPKECTYVAFGWNYDVNMILRDVPLKNLIQLWKTGSTRWNGYSIQWIPSKLFNIRSGKGRSKRIYDVFGFFQSSFVNALKKWGFTPNGEMESMKAQRSAFDSSMKEQIIEYCLDECVQLSELMEELQIALYSVGLETKNWIGAGAIASELMKRHGVKENHEYDEGYEDEQLTKEIRRAYFGGRVELYKQGHFRKLWDYDIISAYPSKAMYLPQLSNGQWVRVSEYEPELLWAIWDTEWSLPQSTILCPFPVRKGGDIFYPTNGRGTYHSCEVDAAKRIYGDKIQVNGGWQFIPGSDNKPFRWIPAEFEHRRKLKAEGHAGEKCLKLGLNSIYGKLAQGAGYGDKPPPFQSYFWAGYITSATRATVLDVASKGIDDLVMVATDGIFFDKDPGIPESAGLGGLELETMDDCFVAQPGIYSQYFDGETIGKSRGFFNKEIDFDVLRKGFDEQGPYYIAYFKSTRFLGLGSALLTHNLDDWRKWKETERKLSLYPNRKFIKDDKPTNGYLRHWPGSMPEDHISEAYTPKPGFATMTDEELNGELAALINHIQGTEQPLKEY